MNIPLPVRYGFFALIAMAGNLGSQWLATKAGQSVFCPQTVNGNCGVGIFSLTIAAADLIFWGALVIGTLVGFLIKYILDKKFIFYYRIDSFRKDLFTFFLYSCMAVLTTLIFWGVQWFFNTAFAWAGAKYIGGLIGLVTGYTLKYFLDKRFVFTKRGS
jgi:putative flippase GtrA